MAAQRLGAHGTAWIAIAMAWCAGFVDAAAYTEVDRIYTSHMTGNTTSLATRLVQDGWGAASCYGWVIVYFLIGMLISASLTHAERRRGIRSAFAAALGLELVLLIVFVLAGRFRRRIVRVLLVTTRNVSAQHATLTAGLWIAFFAGAIAGFTGDLAWNRVALILPMIVLAGIIVIDLRYPVALGEVSDDEIRTD